MARKKVRTFQEAMAIKSAITNLNKKLGIRRVGKIKRTRDMQFVVYE